MERQPLSRNVPRRIPRAQIELSTFASLLSLASRIHYTPDFGKSLPEMRFRRHFVSLSTLSGEAEQGWVVRDDWSRDRGSTISTVTVNTLCNTESGLLKQTRSAQSIQRQSYPFRKLHGFRVSQSRHDELICLEIYFQRVV